VVRDDISWGVLFGGTRRHLFLKNGLKKIVGVFFGKR